jgi:hypothetical protein
LFSADEAGRFSPTRPSSRGRGVIFRAAEFGKPRSYTIIIVHRSTNALEGFEAYRRLGREDWRIGKQARRRLS